MSPFLTISSNSMSPMLVRGDEIVLISAPTASLQPGEIVTLVAGTTFVTHRFWGRVGEQLVTKGDRSLAFDPPWMPADLLGLVACRRRAGQLLPLNEGHAAKMNQRIFDVARLELRVFAGFGPNPLEDALRERWLGRRLRQDRGFLPARIIRRTFRIYAGLLDAIMSNRKSRSDSPGERTYTSSETEA